MRFDGRPILISGAGRGLGEGIARQLASEGAIVAYTMPVWAALLAWPVLGEGPPWRRVAALALGLLSLGVVIGGRGIDLAPAAAAGPSHGRR